MKSHNIPPRMRPTSRRRNSILSVLDVGTSKIVCLIVRIQPEDNKVANGQSFQILGIGHQRSRGLKAGAVVDMEEAEQSIRLAVDAAERMAGVQVERVIVNLSGGRLGSHLYQARISVGGRPVSEHDIQRVLEATSNNMTQRGRAVLHAIPTSFTLDGTPGIRHPKGMIGDELGADMHIASCDTAAARNLMLVVERCHLSIEAMVATPYAAALSVLTEDEMKMGAVVIDMGGGTTSTAVFSNGHLIHVDAIAVGGNHVTMDIARGLTMRLADAERLKILHGCCITSGPDDHEVLNLDHGAQEAASAGTLAHLSKGQLTRVIKPRVDEILELVRDRLGAAGLQSMAHQNLVLTGGASQLAGMCEAAGRIISPNVRLARPAPMPGLPETAIGPGFSVAAGLTAHPNFARLEHFEPQRHAIMQATGTDGYISRVSRWLKDSF